MIQQNINWKIIHRDSEQPPTISSRKSIETRFNRVIEDNYKPNVRFQYDFIHNTRSGSDSLNKSILTSLLKPNRTLLKQKKSICSNEKATTIKNSSS